MAYTELVKLILGLLCKLREKRRYDRLIAARTHDVLHASLSENGIDPVYKYGFTCTRLARKHVETALKRYYRLLDDRKILYINFP